MKVETGLSLFAAVSSIVCCLRQPTYMIAHRSPPFPNGIIQLPEEPPRTISLTQPANRHAQAQRAADDVPSRRPTRQVSDPRRRAQFHTGSKPSDSTLIVYRPKRSKVKHDRLRYVGDVCDKYRELLSVCVQMFATDSSGGIEVRSSMIVRNDPTLIGGSRRRAWLSQDISTGLTYR